MPSPMLERWLQPYLISLQFKKTYSITLFYRTLQNILTEIFALNLYRNIAILN